MGKTQFNNNNFELSYYIAPVGWNGEEVTFDPVQAESQFRNLHDAGIKWTGISGVNMAEKINFDLDAAVEQMKSWMKKYDICLSSFHFAGITSAGVGNSQQKVREDMLKSVEIFSRLSPNAFVVHAGWFADDTNSGMFDIWRNETEKYGQEKVISLVAENLKIMAQALEKYKINIAIETMGKFLPLGRRDNIDMLIKMIDEANAGYCLDSGHAHAAGESVVAWVKHCGDKLFETHFHDNRALVADIKDEFGHCTTKIDEHLPPGFGTIPWIDVIHALWDINFAGPVTFETLGWPGYHPAEGFKYVVEWWKTIESIANSSTKRK